MAIKGSKLLQNLTLQYVQAGSVWYGANDIDTLLSVWDELLCTLSENNLVLSASKIAVDF